MSRRTERLNHLLRQELAYLLQHQVRDPRLSGLISITKVSVSPDIRDAYVFVSIMGDESQRRLAMEGLDSASGFLRHELASKLPWRRIPQLHFQRDDSLERGATVLKLIKQFSQEREPKEK
jgi:ribosome-binding factor A